MGGISMTHILLFVIILILLFGAKRLPEIGGAFGKSIREFRKGVRAVQDDVGRPASGGDQPKAVPPSDVSRTS
jgi:sec-independent protein translocase protein TatA